VREDLKRLIQGNEEFEITNVDKKKIPKWEILCIW